MFLNININIVLFVNFEGNGISFITSSNFLSRYRRADFDWINFSFQVSYMSGLKSLYAKQRVRNPASPYCSKCSCETFFNSSFPLVNLSKITLSAPYQRAYSVLESVYKFNSSLFTYNKYWR